MGFFSKLFKLHRAYENEPDADWDEVVYDHAKIDFSNEEQRSRYIESCLEQVSEADREIGILENEYRLVTDYLTDMEEIEALPGERKEELEQIARHLISLEQERQQFINKKDRMKDADFFRMRKQEEEVEEGIGKLREAERYGKMVKSDLQRLDRERHAYSYRKNELLTMMANYRGMAVIFITALIACLVMLFVLRFAFEMNTYAGVFITILAGAVAITLVCVKYMDAERELMSVEKSISKLIQLQNKVKIRYVNNRNLLNYLYIKYGTESVEELEKKWAAYLEEKELRKQYAEAESKTGYFQNELVKILTNYRVRDPERWIHQAAAILDRREMVEIRHELILQRQNLRQQLDYNQGVAKTAREEIMSVVREYPKYAEEIMGMMENFEQNA